MTPFLWGLTIGIFVGANVGLLIFALISANGRKDHYTSEDDK